MRSNASLCQLQRACIHAALAREHGYRGSYSAVRRMLAGIRASLPPETTVPLYFEPAEAAQADFGAGPFLLDPARGAIRRTWCFVMTLCFSRHQYLEFVFDQSVMSWLGCHRRAFEWFARVPQRLIIDNPKCAHPCMRARPARAARICRVRRRCH
jgi:transposase